MVQSHKGTEPIGGSKLTTMAPKITVIVPVLNEESLLRDTLQSIRTQTFTNYELIVVDNGSTDKSPKIAKQLADRVLVEERKGPLFATHRGFENANSELVTSCDADTLYPKNWLEKMVKALSKKDTVAVYGPIAFRESAPFVRLLTLIAYSILDRLSLLTGVRIAGGANLGIRKGAYFVAGGYRLGSEIASQDFRLVKRLSQLGKVKFSSSLVCYTANRRYTQVNFAHGLKEAFCLWLDVALGKDTITYDDYYGEDYYGKKADSAHCERKEHVDRRADRS